MPFDITIETKAVFYMVMPSDRKLRPAAQIFCDWLRHVVDPFHSAQASTPSNLMANTE
jgi:hypothetical protein